MSHSRFDQESALNKKGSVRELVLRAKSGEELAVNRLLERYRPYLRVVCSLQLPQFCQKREDESDIVQKTLIDATRGMGDFRGVTEEEFGAWMEKLLERNILQTIRTHTAGKRDIRRETVDWNPAGSTQLVWHSLAAKQSLPENSVFRGEAALELAQALEKLPEDQRIAIELRYLGQKSLRWIADYMSKSTSSVAGLIHRGVASLRDLLPAELPE